MGEFVVLPRLRTACGAFASVGSSRKFRIIDPFPADACSRTFRGQVADLPLPWNDCGRTLLLDVDGSRTWRLPWKAQGDGLIADTDSARLRPVFDQTNFADRLLPWPWAVDPARLFRVHHATCSRTLRPCSHKGWSVSAIKHPPADANCRLTIEPRAF